MSKNQSSLYCLGLGEKLSFRKDSYVIDKYLLDGWSGQEQWYRWTEGKSASLQFHLPESSTDNITLRAECFGFLGNGKISRQSVNVLINDSKLTTWKVSTEAWHEVIIPKELIKKGEMKVTFLISNAASPFELKISDDKRKLGVCFKNLEIVESGIKSTKPLAAKSEACLQSNHLNFGEKLPFGANAYVVDRYLTDGWHAQEPGRRWIDGGRGSLQFHVPEIGTQNIVLRAECLAFLAKGKFDQQSVEVRANDKQIATWKVDSEGWVEYNAVIPNELVKSGNVKITFLVSNPISPLDAKLSADTRKMGLAFQSLEIAAEEGKKSTKPKQA